MNLKKLLVFIALAMLSFSQAPSAKTLLEKSIYFVDPQTNKMDSCKYWKLFIGTYPATLVRKFPGEDSLPVNTDLNLTILSSGYIEGYGYTRKGRVDCNALFVADTGTGSFKVAVDSIEYVVDGGTKVKPKNMKVCNLALDVEGNKLPGVKRFLLTKYKLVTEYEERNLKPQGDVPITWFAFSKNAFLTAQKAQAELEKAASEVK